MEKLIVTELDEDTLKKLYVDHNLRDKEIGEIFGITDGAVAFKRKKFSIPTNPRGLKRSSIEIEHTGVKKNLRKELTDDVLKELYIDKRMTDERIGKLFDITGEAVGQRRRTVGIKSRDNVSRRKERNKSVGLNDIDDLSREEIVKELRMCKGIKGVSRKYGTSYTTVTKKIYELKISEKEFRERKKELTRLQKDLIVGGLLGDGGLVSVSSISAVYRESHCIDQESYLDWKVRLLNNVIHKVSYTRDKNDTGTISYGKVFRTKSLEDLREFYDPFYSGKTEEDAKRIPLNLIKNLSNISLAVWYFDDGSLINKKIPVIYTKAPYKDVEGATTVLNELFDLDCHSKKGNIHSIVIGNVSSFFSAIRDYIPKCMIYKVPREYIFKVSSLSPRVASLDKKVQSYTPQEWRKLNKETKDEWVSNIAEYYQLAGFPYYSYHGRDKVLDVISRLTNYSFDKKVHKDVLIRFPNIGVDLANSYFPNMWSSKGGRGRSSAYNNYKDSKKFRTIIRKVLTHQSFLNDSSIRYELRRYGKIHNFKPLVAKYIYDRYCPLNARVLDYSSGWGGRLLGSFVSSRVKEYIGIEPSIQTFYNLRAFSRRLWDISKDTVMSFINGCAEDFDTYEGIGEVDFCFSSPPYFNAEIYSDEDTQSSVRYKEIEVWLDKFIGGLVYNCYRVLKPGGFFAINIADIPGHSLQGPVFEICSKVFSYEASLVFILPKLNGGEKYEPIFVFKKDLDGSNVNPSYSTIKDDMDTRFGNVQKVLKSPYDYNRINREYKIRGNTELSEKDKELCIEAIKAIALSGKSYSRSSVGKMSVRSFPFPTWSIEKTFGTWNNFLKEAQLDPITEFDGPFNTIKLYFDQCVSEEKCLSFYEYGIKNGEKYRNRMKRLFNRGKKYHHLKQELFDSALDTVKQTEFLKKISEN